MTYTFDGDGQRVMKSNGSTGMLYWKDTGGSTRAESDLAGAISAEYMYFQGKIAARVDRPSNAVKFYFPDHLGTNTIIGTPGTGSAMAVQESDYYPYGGEITISSSGDPNRYKFTGKERDSESGLDNFGARYHGPNMGRFMTPDPSPMGIALLDPQSWNLYSYVRNRPTRAVDVGGNWATDIHVQITTFALQGYLSAGELAELNHQQYVMDADQGDQNKHAMANPGANGSPDQSPEDAKNGAWNFVDAQMYTAMNEVRTVGHLTKRALDALGNAAHTMQDYTSPMHTDSNFNLLVWRGGYTHPSVDAAHYAGESDPGRDWARIGLAVRFTMWLYMQIDPNAAKNGLTEKTFNSESDKKISDYVRWYFASTPDYRRSGPGDEEAARQCALGNRAACD